MAKVKVWKRVDGGISVTNFDGVTRLPNETEDEMIERESIKLRLADHLKGSEEIIIDESNVTQDKSNREKWRLHPNKGSVIVDNSVILPEEVRQGFLVSAKSKLKAGAPLTDEEIDAMFKRI